MLPVLDYINSKEDKQREILLFIHDLMLSYEGVTSKIRFKIPFYYRTSWICYANPLKGRGVELVFLRANEFTTNIDLLDSKGRKQVAGITIDELEAIPDELSEVISEALNLDATTRYKSKRFKK